MSANGKMNMKFLNTYLNALAIYFTFVPAAEYPRPLFYSVAVNKAVYHIYYIIKCPRCKVFPEILPNFCAAAAMRAHLNTPQKTARSAQHFVYDAPAETLIALIQHRVLPGRERALRLVCPNGELVTFP